MPVLPTIESEESVRVGGIDVYADGNNFGAQIGRAVENAGNQISQLASEFRTTQKNEDARTRQERLATSTADGEINLARIHAENQVNAPEDGSGVFDATLSKQREWIEAEANKIKDPIERTAFRTEMLGKVVPYAKNNIDFELNTKAKLQASQTDYTLRGLENTVRSSSDSYETVLASGNKIIDAQSGVPASAKPGMRREWGERVANARFQGLLDVAATPDDFDAIGAQLKEDTWKEAFKPEEYERVMGELGAAKKTFMSQASTQAGALIDSARTQIDTGTTPIDPTRMKEIHDAAELSQNPTKIRQAMELDRHNQILLQHKGKPAAELQGRANEIKNGGFGLPDQLNKSIGNATRVFPGLSGAFFGGLANMEYGVHLQSGRTARGKAKFAPTAIHKGVDLRGMAPQTYNAASLAGEIFGAPLPITSAYRSQAKQDALRYAKGKNPFRKSIAKESRHTEGDAIDVSTVGMTAQQKGKLVDAMLQAGFTAFGEYGTHIHGDMRAVTPNSFNAATGQLGWTKGSPEVIGALTARGYGAAMPRDKINRGNAAGAAPQIVADMPAIDYGKGTQNGSTSAVGVTQMTEGTWLGIMKNPAIAQRIGLPPNLSDAQLLELRKDPDWSMLGTGAYAEQNKRILETVLGRGVTEPELYMAHLMGPGGAQSFLSAYDKNPEAVAAELMPQAAKNNPGKFYTKGGRPLTVREAYDNINVQFSTAPNQVAYGDAQMYERMAEGKRTRETNDTMTTYSQTVAPVNNLQDEGGFASRSAFVLGAADLYDMPVADVKPFTGEEASQLTKTMSEGSVDQKLQLIQQINELDRKAPGAGAAAMAQIGQKDSVLSYAAALANERGATDVAETIVRGQSRLAEGKSLDRTMFGKEGDQGTALDMFNSVSGGIFSGMPPGTYDAAFNAAKAYYAEKAAGRAISGFDDALFTEAVQAVSGSADPNSPAIGTINNEPTLMPPGVTPVEFSNVVENLTDADVIEFSANGLPPVDVLGDPMPAEDLRDEAVFIAVGDNKYKLRMLDGNYAVTKEGDGKGRARLYLFDADPARIKQKAVEPVAETMTDPTGLQNMTPAQQQDLFDKGIEQMYGTQ